LHSNPYSLWPLWITFKHFVWVKTGKRHCMLQGSSGYIHCAFPFTHTTMTESFLNSALVDCSFSIGIMEPTKLSLQEDDVICSLERVCVQVSLCQCETATPLIVCSHPTTRQLRRQLMMGRISLTHRPTFCTLLCTDHMHHTDHCSSARALQPSWIALLATWTSARLRTGCDGRQQLPILLIKQPLLWEYLGSWHPARPTLIRWVRCTLSNNQTKSILQPELSLRMTVWAWSVEVSL
jgi:hypothetical protein